METQSKGKKALIAALMGSPVVVALVVKYLDPIAWYKQYKAPPPPPPPAARVVIDAKLDPFLGFSHGVFESANKWTMSQITLNIVNSGSASSQDLYIELDFPDDTKVDEVTGDWRMEFKKDDGTFRPIDQAKSWNNDLHNIVLHIPKLESNDSEGAKLQYRYLTVNKLEVPKYSSWDSMGKYGVKVEK